jgi:predicted small metal-binding protein
MKELRCKDAGMDCGFVARADSEGEVVKLAAEHAKKDHNMAEVSQEMAAKMRSLIREV